MKLILLKHFLHYKVNNFSNFFLTNCISGLSADDERVDISYFANPLVGCMRNVVLETSPLKTAPLEPIRPLISTVNKNIDENCLNKCWEKTVKCSRDSKCINHYDHVECDCFNARFKGEKCKDTSKRFRCQKD
jgi:hypothetical protein